jgi:hypothetical protein
MEQLLERRVPRSFSIKQSLLLDLERQVPIGARSRWIENVLDSALRETEARKNKTRHS